ncbi:uncharacterized protein LOC117566595 [Drosophila albomicans]|uniref:Uncharacterized protein LOC117566595 n=1 Tax=Drosophila albomicans TaxID=7291 RepID=A0A6P8WRR4_DROAB|nr:uncharacterized protein LOC117566595 [Drosophila albomicans]
MKSSAQIVLLTSLATCWASKLYSVEIILFEALEVEGEPIIDFTDIRLMGRERALNGTVRINEDMDATNFQMSVDFQTDPLRNGEWRNMIFSVPQMNICRAMRMYIGTYGKSTLQRSQHTNLPFDGKHCPLPKGTYYIKDLLMNSDTWPEIMPIGYLNGNFRFLKRGKLIGGVKCLTEISQSILML